ncbi:MAG TPA: MJ0042-type zinc finger domain-containing protein, partial [Kofleriaceae bacterium]|nr:MJ0042-type zinc finger domain-containing protein [Kofleriaceae bacterium]
MLEVACAVCGAVYRFSPTDVPAGGKTVTCARCKARIVVQAPPPPPPMAGGTGDVIDLGAGPDPIDLPRTDGGEEITDLPAPKAAGPIAPPEVVDLPAPRLIPRNQATELTLDNIDLLAPVGPTRSRPPVTPAVVGPPPAEAPPARSRMVPAAIPDLPAPKRSSEPVRPSFATPQPSFAPPGGP